MGEENRERSQTAEPVEGAVPLPIDPILGWVRLGEGGHSSEPLPRSGRNTLRIEGPAGAGQLRALAAE